VLTRLTLSQRLTRADGVPTAVARAGAALLVCSAAAMGFAAGPDRAPSSTAAARPLAAERLVRELPIATPEPRPALRKVVALPVLRKPSRAARRAGRAAEPVAASMPVPATTAEPAATAEPVATAAPAAPVRPVRPRAAPPAPRPTPGPTFDSRG
jgi:hypothetical protein